MDEAIFESGRKEPGDLFEAGDEVSKMNVPLQNCPNCGIFILVRVNDEGRLVNEGVISAIPGSRDSVCQNCGYKDPCCE